jgi:hypothetical protein
LKSRWRYWRLIPQFHIKPYQKPPDRRFDDDDASTAGQDQFNVLL